MNQSEPVNPALARLQASVRIGGKGSVRRKKKVVHKTTTTDDKRLQNTLKRLGINSIPAIEEVNLFMDQGEVIHFVNPKVQASIAANTYVIIGVAETKQLQDLFPGILNQVDKSVLPSLKKIAEQYNPAAEEDEEDDEEVPDLVENFS
jgi:nascent polypeptide-associated complex subunit beta